MSPALRLLPPAAQRPDDVAARRTRPWEAWVALAVVLAAGLLAAAWPDPADEAIRRMAPAERQALYLRTRANAAALCGREPALGAACREELRLLRRLPECDDACRAEADAAWPRPTR